MQVFLLLLLFLLFGGQKAPLSCANTTLSQKGIKTTFFHIEMFTNFMAFSHGL